MLHAGEKVIIKLIINQLLESQKQIRLMIKGTKAWTSNFCQILYKNLNMDIALEDIFLSRVALLNSADSYFLTIDDY